MIIIIIIIIIIIKRSEEKLMYKRFHAKIKTDTTTYASK